MDRQRGASPCNFRIYHKGTRGFTGNDHFKQMLLRASGRPALPHLVQELVPSKGAKRAHIAKPIFALDPTA